VLPTRLLVEAPVYDEVVGTLKQLAGQFRIGAALDPATTFGPVIDRRACDRILNEIQRAKADGDGRLVTGGRRVGGELADGYFIEPTVFADVHDEMTIAKEEIFGPVMSIIKFNDLDEVIERANRTMYGLAAAVWTRDVSKALAVANGVRAGTVWVNCYDVFDPGAPFGGFKQSGMGREMGEYGLQQYTEVKTVTVKL